MYGEVQSMQEIIWIITGGLLSLCTGVAILAIGSGLFKPGCGVIKLDIGLQVASTGGSLVIAGLLALYLAIFAPELLSHFL